MSCTVSKSVEFDAGHRVPAHDSKCRHPHGHRYRVTAYVSGPVHDARGQADDGMVLDFGVLKQMLTQLVHDRYDHAFLVWEGDQVLLGCFEHGGHDWRVVVVPFVPTAECLAKAIFDELDGYLPAPLTLEAIDVNETPTSVATYERPAQRGPVHLPADASDESWEQPVGERLGGLA